jgi:hypothetical protein
MVANLTGDGSTSLDFDLAVGNFAGDRTSCPDEQTATYNEARGLDLPDCPDLLFHERLTDYDAKRGRPGIVAVIRDPTTGAVTGAASTAPFSPTTAPARRRSTRRKRCWGGPSASSG